MTDFEIRSHGAAFLLRPLTTNAHDWVAVQLSEALTALSKRMEIHPALKGGMEKLYGFTSDEDGIRHPILDEPNVGEEDARFFIVACSALVN